MKNFTIVTWNTAQDLFKEIEELTEMHPRAIITDVNAVDFQREEPMSRLNVYDDFGRFTILKYKNVLDAVKDYHGICQALKSASKNHETYIVAEACPDEITFKSPVWNDI